MPDDPNVVPKSAVLQSITAEANGFYGVVVTVASTFLGGSLLFLEKFAPARNSWSIVVMAIGWISLVASIGCIARIRFMNLRSGKLALLDQFDKAEMIDRHTDMLSNWAQWLLIGGMSALVFMGVLNFSQITNDSLKLSTSAPVSQTPPQSQGSPANPTRQSDSKK
jgi:hypothetical protein